MSITNKYTHRGIKSQDVLVSGNLLYYQEKKKNIEKKIYYPYQK